MFGQLKKMDRKELYGLIAFALTIGPALSAAGLIMMTLTGRGTSKGVLLCLVGTAFLAGQWCLARLILHGSVL